MDNSQPNKLLARTLQTAAFILIAGKKIYLNYVAGRYAWANLDDHLLERLLDCGLILLIISAVAEIYDRYLSPNGRRLAIIGATLVICGIFLGDIMAHTGLVLTDSQMLITRISSIVVGVIMGLYAAGKREELLEELKIETEADEN